MKKISAIIILLLVVFSCEKELIEKPEDLIPKDKMTDILYDISLLYASKGVNTGQIDFSKITLDDFVYKQYGVDSTQVANSTIYYSSKPEEYLKMYETIQKRLRATKDTIIERRRTRSVSDSVSPAEKFKLDSLERERKLREYIDTND